MPISLDLAIFVPTDDDNRQNRLLYPRGVNMGFVYYQTLDFVDPLPHLCTNRKIDISAPKTCSKPKSQENLPANNCCPEVIAIQKAYYTKPKRLFVQCLISLVYSCRYGEAEKDCSLALALDDSYIKAYYRRATARLKLGKLEDAKLGTPNDIAT